MGRPEGSLQCLRRSRQSSRCRPVTFEASPRSDDGRTRESGVEGTSNDDGRDDVRRDVGSSGERDAAAPAGGTIVRVERGTVLVTQEGDLDDHVLERGDEFVLSTPGLAVAWATNAALSICPAVHRLAA